MMLALDTGASFVLTSFKSEFVDNLQCDIPIKYISKVNKVIGIGTTIQNINNSKRDDVYLLCLMYHLPKAEISLFSPQTYYEMHGENRRIYSEIVEMNLSGHEVVIILEKKDQIY